MVFSFFFFLFNFFFPPYGLLWEKATGRVFRAAIPWEGFEGEILPAEALSCSHPPEVLPQSLPPLGRGRGLEYLLIARLPVVFKNQLNLCGVFVCRGVTCLGRQQSKLCPGKMQCIGKLPRNLAVSGCDQVFIDPEGHNLQET